MLYIGPEKDKKIILLLTENELGGHYDLINSLSAFFEKNYYCFKCLKGYQKREEHPCNEICKSCLVDKCEKLKDNIR